VEDADALGNAMRSKYGGVAEVRLHLGDMLDRRGMSADARAEYAAAHAIDPGMPAAREALAFYAARDGEVDTALEFLRPVMAARTMRSAAAGRMVAGGLSKKGRHAEAQPILALLLEVFPTLGNDKSFAKELRACEKQVGGTRTKLGTDRMARVRMLAIAGVIVAVAAIVLVADAYAASHRTLYVVNGSGVPVQVEIAGAGSVDLRKSRTGSLEVPSGTYVARVKGAVEREIPFTVASSCWPRFLDDAVFVLDATGTSVLCLEHTTYTASGGDSDSGVRILFGKDFNRLPDVDYVFQPFPKSILTSSSSSRQKKTRVSLVEGSVEEIVYRLMDGQEPRQAYELAEWSLKHDPASLSMLRTFTAAARNAHVEARAGAVLAPRLEKRPVDLDAHGAWQELQPAANQVDLVDGYEKRRAQEPREGAWPWLQGRLSTRVSERLALFEQATFDPRVAPHVWHDLALAQASGGDWAAAQSSARRALGSETDGWAARTIVFDSLAALDMHDELRTELDELLAADPCNWDASMRRLELVPANAPQGEVNQYLVDWEQRAVRSCSTAAHELAFTLRLHSAWLQSDLAGLDRLVNARKDPGLEEWALIALADKGATQALSARLGRRRAPIDPFTALGLALACRAAGDEPTAEECERLALARPPSSRVQAEVKRILEGDRRRSTDAALELALDPWEKSILLALLSFSDESARAKLLETSLALQPRPLFPRRIVERLAAGGH
jgi:tetratricopeptide (TPR) repeat protein